MQKLKEQWGLSLAGLWKRLRHRRRIRIVAIGATPGRSGSSKLVAHLQWAGAKVNRESGIVAPADHVVGVGPQDPLTMYAGSDRETLHWAQQRVERWVDRAGSESEERVLAGGVSVSNTQAIEAFLKAEQRIHRVAHVGDP